MDDDAALEAELRRVALLYDPPPATAVRAAEAAFALRSVDADLALLTSDSYVGVDAVRTWAVRDRLLTFTAATLTVDVELRYAGEPSIVGRLDRPEPVTVDIRTPVSTVTVTTDDLGRFSTGPFGKGPYSLRCHLDPEIVTEWFL